MCRGLASVLPAPAWGSIRWADESRLRLCRLCSSRVFLLCSWIPLGLYRIVSRFASPMQQAEDCRNKDQCCNGRQQQAANDGASEGSILLSAFAGSERHGDHADDHGERRHTYRTETRCACFNRSLDSIPVVCQTLL